MIKTKKKDQVLQIEEIYKSSSAVVVTHYHGLTVSQITKLRNNLQSNGADFKVVKNTLSKIAANNAGVHIDETMFSGPTGIAYSKDPVTAAKEVINFTKGNDNLKVIGGIVNQKILSVTEIETLAKLPSLDELRGKIVGVLQAPASKLARVIQAPAGQIARVIKAHADKG